MYEPYEPDQAEWRRVVESLERCFAVVGHDESGVTLSWDDARALANECEAHQRAGEEEMARDQEEH